MNPIDALFLRLRFEKQKAFIPFIAAGDPDLRTTQRLLGALAEHGAHLVEVGFPYSDPIADGPVIQASYTRALARGITVEAIFHSLAELSRQPAFAGQQVPLVGMASYALVHRQGIPQFIGLAQQSGMSGVIIPDLPLDEAGEMAQAAAARNFKLVQLVTPTTPRDRALRIAELSTGFLYYVSITGITGERDRLPDDLVEQIGWLRSQTNLPICVGFGISRPEHVRMLRDVADGVIVGSALVRRLEAAGQRSMDEITSEIVALAESLAGALNVQ
jgi:tryptophan synthase alpha chain